MARATYDRSDLIQNPCNGHLPEKRYTRLQIFAEYLHCRTNNDGEGSDPSTPSAGQAIRALDIAKRLIDYNFHPPTNYFPLIVHEALMIEPTETENKDTLDAFAEALIKIAEEARTQPDLLHNAPSATQFGTIVDEVKAARELVLCCWLPEGYDRDLIAE